MKSGCEVTYADAITDALFFDVEGVPIPFASPKTLWRMKQTVRAKDIPDRLYLQQLLHAQGIQAETATPAAPGNSLAAWWREFKTWWQKGRSQ